MRSDWVLIPSLDCKWDVSLSIVFLLWWLCEVYIVSFINSNNELMASMLVVIICAEYPVLKYINKSTSHELWTLFWYCCLLCSVSRLFPIHHAHWEFPVRSVCLASPHFTPYFQFISFLWILFIFTHSQRKWRKQQEEKDCQGTSVSSRQFVWRCFARHIQLSTFPR